MRNGGSSSRSTAEQRLHGTLPLVDATGAAELVSDDATILMSGFGSVGYPKAVPLALAESGRNLSLTVVTGGSAGDEVDVALVEADAIERRYPFQARAPIRNAINEQRIAFSDSKVGSLGDEVQYGGLVDPDVAIVEAVAVGEDWLVPSTSIGQTPAFVEASSHLVVEINHAQPLDLATIHDVYRPGRPPNREPIPLREPDGRIGGPRIPFDSGKLEAVVETARSDSTYSFRDPTDDDRAVAANFGEFLVDELDRTPVFQNRIHLQFGMGSLGNALMSELPSLDYRGRDVVYFGEVIQDGLLDMLDSGRMESASATALALTEPGQERLFENIERYATDIVLRPTDVSNNPALIDRFGVVGVNSAIEVDIFGNANSTHVGGSRIVNGIGGAADFNSHALVSVCALPSTHKNGSISRVVPMVPHVDTTDHDVDVVVTEQGVADLRGSSPIERAELIIEECVHPSFRPQLREHLEAAIDRGGHYPLAPERALDWDG